MKIYTNISAFFLLFLLGLSFNSYTQDACNHPDRYVQEIFNDEQIQVTNNWYALFKGNEMWRGGIDIDNCFDYHYSIQNQECASLEPNNEIRSYLRRIIHNEAQDTTFQIWLTVYQPDSAFDACKNRPAIIFVHGGGFTFEHRGNANRNSALNREVAMKYAKKGFIVAMIDYRKGFDLREIDVPPHISCHGLKDLCVENEETDSLSFMRAIYRNTQDVKSAHAFLHYFSEDLNVDTNRIIYQGASTGGIIALSAAFINDNDWNVILNQSNSEIGKYAREIYLLNPMKLKPFAVVATVAAIPYDVNLIKENDIKIIMASLSDDELVPTFTGEIADFRGFNGQPFNHSYYKMQGIHEIYRHIQKKSDNNRMHAYMVNNYKHGSLNPTLDNCTSNCKSEVLHYLEDKIHLSLKEALDDNFSSNSFCLLTNTIQHSFNLPENQSCKEICWEKLPELAPVESTGLYFNGEKNVASINHEGKYNFFSFSTNQSSCKLDNQFTLEFVFSADKVQNHAFPLLFSNFMSLTEANRFNGFQIGIDNESGQVKIELANVSDGFSTYHFETANLKDESCHHLALTRLFDKLDPVLDDNYGFYELTIDGKIVGTFNGIFNLNSRDKFWIGNNAEINSGFKGYLKEMRFWRTYRPNYDINHFMDIQLNPIYYDNLIGYWKMNEGIGKIIENSSSVDYNFHGLLGDDIDSEEYYPTWKVIDCKPIIEDTLVSNNGLNLYEQNIDVGIFPNPFYDILNIHILKEIFDSKKYFFSLYNSLGIMVKKPILLIEGQNRINTNNLSSGAYFYQLTTDDMLIKKGLLVK